MYKVELQNIKGIKKLVFSLPTKKGVYVLTGANGCGKTTLLVALCRIGNNQAFKAYQIKENDGCKIDTYKEASITYIVEDKKVVYQHKNKRWNPIPKGNSKLILNYPFKNTLFISTMGMRFFSQDSFNVKRIVFNAVSPDLVKSMNMLLDTNRFENLKYITVKNKRGRQKKLHRDNKLYVIKNLNVIYSEKNFSLGERLLLNILDELEHIQRNSMLLIDEVELALHPIAQVKFFDYLKDKANEKNLVIIISTHSSSLINHAEKLLYLKSNECGEVEVKENCLPAYILKDLSALEERKPDIIFFVEDKMAFKYLIRVWQKFKSDMKSDIYCSVIPVGGYEQVVEMVSQAPSLGFNKKYVQAFLDNDVEGSIRALKSKGEKQTEAEKRKLKLFADNDENISYLNITPELGIWNFIENNANDFEDFFETRHGSQLCKVSDLIVKTLGEEKKENCNLRKWAKGCLKNFKEKINLYFTTISEDSVIDTILDFYVERNYNLDASKAKFLPIINRRR